MERRKLPDISELAKAAAAHKFFAVRGERCLFLDPLTGTPLTPGMPPPCLANDPLVGHGLETLQRWGHRLRVRLLLGMHGCPEDFNDLLAVGEADLRRAPCVFVEASADESQPPRNFPPEIELSEDPGRAAFQRTELDWLHRARKLTLPCQRPTPKGDPLADRMRDLWQMVLTHPDNATRLVADGAYQAVRHWTILAQLGEWLARPEVSAKVQASDAPVVLVVGAWHRPSVARLQSYCHVQADAMEAEDRYPEWEAHGRLFMRMMQDCGVRVSELTVAMSF